MASVAPFPSSHFLLLWAPPPPTVLPLPRSLWSCLRHHLRHHVLSQASPRGGKRPATVTGRWPPFLSHSAHAAGAASVQAPCCSPGVLGRAEHPPSLTRGEGCAAAPDTVSDNRKRATRGIGTKEAGSRGALRKGGAVNEPGPGGPLGAEQTEVRREVKGTSCDQAGEPHGHGPPCGRESRGRRVRPAAARPPTASQAHSP